MHSSQRAAQMASMICCRQQTPSVGNGTETGGRVVTSRQKRLEETVLLCGFPGGWKSFVVAVVGVVCSRGCNVFSIALSSIVTTSDVHYMQLTGCVRLLGHLLWWDSCVTARMLTSIRHQLQTCCFGLRMYRVIAHGESV